MSEPANATPEEQRILADICAKTGLTFGRVGGIPTNDPAIAKRVLPILATWYAAMSDAGHRSEVVRRFQHPTAHDYLDEVLEWWKTEPDTQTRGYITQVVAGLMNAADADKVWTAYREVPEDPFSVLILHRLAGYSQSGQLARKRAFEILTQGHPGYGPLEVISRIKDVRIRRWFREHLDDPDPNIRKLAVRVAKRGKPLPFQVERSQAGPQMNSALFSAEGSLNELEDFFTKAEGRGCPRIPVWLRRAEFLDQVERDEWVYSDVWPPSGSPARVWLRLEDIDAVELVITSLNGVVSRLM